MVRNGSQHHFRARSPARTPSRLGGGATLIEARLREAGVRRLVVGGLATDYCVLQTVLDARRRGFEVVVLRDAIAAVDPAAGARALDEMAAAGAAIA
jgi:nicotinamidase/pyrazinamidase